MLIDDLRAATEDNHRRTEAAFDLKAACASRDAYADLLSIFLGLYRPLERRLEALPWGEAGLDWPERRKLSLLERDLAALGRDPDAVADRATDAVPLASVTPAFGVLYVIEGSTLGGQFIRKHVGRTLGLDAASGCAFFTGYGERTAPMWAQFIEAANRAGDASPAEQPAARDAAIKTFELFEASFRR